MCKAHFLQAQAEKSWGQAVHVDTSYFWSLSRIYYSWRAEKVNGDVCVWAQKGLVQLYLHIALTQRGMMAGWWTAGCYLLRQMKDLAFYFHVFTQIMSFFPSYLLMMTIWHSPIRSVCLQSNPMKPQSISVFLSATQRWRRICTSVIKQGHAPINKPVLILLLVFAHGLSQITASL